jgi:adenylate cyclase class 2
MSRSAREIEIKLPFPSASEARRRIESAGATQTTPRTFEDNRLYDRPDGGLHAAGKALRLRRAGEGAWLTYKAKVRGDHRHKVREEHETGVDDPDALERIFGGLDFAPSFRYQKYRTEFARGELAICLDETPLGCFVELEGAPEEIDRAAGELGFSTADYVRESYLDLHEADTRRRGVPRGDLLLEADELP